MQELMKKFRLPKLHLVCSTDKLRPSFKHVMITKENIVATNAHVLIELKTKYYFNDDFINDMPDKMFIHKNNFKQLTLLSYGYKYNAEKQLIELFYDGYKKYIQVIIDPDFIFHNYEKAFPVKIEEVRKVGLYLDNFDLINKALFLPDMISNVKVKFYGENRAIVISPKDEFTENRALIMPIHTYE